MPAAHGRFRRHALVSRAGQGKGRAPASFRHQDHEGGRGRGGENGRGHQDALHQDLPGVNLTLAVSASSPRPTFRLDLSRPILLLFSAALCLLTLLPLSWLVYYSLHDRAGGFTLANFALLVTDPIFLDPLVTTVTLATSSAV